MFLADEAVGRSYSESNMGIIKGIVSLYRTGKENHIERQPQAYSCGRITKESLIGVSQSLKNMILRNILWVVCLNLGSSKPEIPKKPVTGVFGAENGRIKEPLVLKLTVMYIVNGERIQNSVTYKVEEKALYAKLVTAW
ncbi:uncharacterized protein [Montipora capricornis]|uniref:uncharacterized protein isoform X2 n=1 Tax=Montipora capricornis TaxID=246305 RepID=UPI0035F21B84